MAFKFGPASMKAVTMWGQKELADKAAAKRIAQEEADMRLRSQLALENEKNLAEQKYTFDMQHGLLEKPRDPLADFERKLEIEQKYKAPVGQPVIEDMGGGLIKVTDSATGEWKIMNKPKAGRSGGGGDGYSYGGTGSGNKPSDSELLPGYQWKSSRTAKGATTWTQVPIPQKKGAPTEAEALKEWMRFKASGGEWSQFPQAYKKFFPKKGEKTAPPPPEQELFKRLVEATKGYENTPEGQKQFIADASARNINPEAALSAWKQAYPNTKTTPEYTYDDGSYSAPKPKEKPKPKAPEKKITSLQEGFARGVK